MKGKRRQGGGGAHSATLSRYGVDGATLPWLESRPKLARYSRPESSAVSPCTEMAECVAKALPVGATTPESGAAAHSGA